ncbi:MAG: hypothetical protein CMH22_05980 [Methylophaga sp.]|nr:hypothetical protein [Methylophaga sp.]|tara:strand:+ start:64950 stop:65177 length:228 start_codon:yes stop_codon:yes gene_type:complete
MLAFTIDNYEVHKYDVETDSNYNVGISVYSENDLKFGFHEKQGVKDTEVLEAVLNGIKRYEKSLKAKTLEEFLNI